MYSLNGIIIIHWYVCMWILHGDKLPQWTTVKGEHCCSYSQLLQTCLLQLKDKQLTLHLFFKYPIYLTLIHCWLTESSWAVDVCSCQDAVIQECSGRVYRVEIMSEAVLFVEPWFVSFCLTPSDEANENETSGSFNNQLSWKQGRQLLRQ